METTFGERLQDAMSAAGYATPEGLAKACKLPRQTIATWLKSKRATLPAERLYLVASVLRVRLGWLVTGEGTMARMHPPHFDRISEVLDRLNEKQRNEWIVVGERMGRRK